MPRYGYASLPNIQGGGPAYNPYFQGPDWSSWVQAIYANLEQARQQKKTERQSDEDRAWQKMANDLKKQAAELELQQAKQAIKDYVSPQAKREADIQAELEKEERAHKNALEIEKIRGEYRLKANAQTAAAKAADEAKKAMADQKAQQANMAAYRKARANVETNYTNTIKNIEGSFSTGAAKIRADKNLLADQKSYLVALQGNLASRKRMLDEASKRKSDELAEIDRLYQIGDAEGIAALAETIPPDVLAAAKAQRPDLTDEEIIRQWRARNKK